MSETVKPPKSKEARHPERTFGDWHEYRSSSGKLYYYNWQTRQNTWAKPADWSDERAKPGRAKNGRMRPISTGPQNRTGQKGPVNNSGPQIDVKTMLANLAQNQSLKALKPAKTENENSSLSQPSPVPKNPKKMWQKGFSSENLALDNQATNSNGIGFHQTGSNVPLRAERYARKRQRVEEFKSQIVELPQLPELSHFEALRPCADPNLIAPDVKNLLQGNFRLFFQYLISRVGFLVGYPIPRKKSPDFKESPIPGIKIPRF